MSTAGTQAEGSADLQPDERVTYKTVGDVRLQVHLFRPAASGAPGLRPAIVFFFGGGWTSGSPQQFYPHCRHLASQGMVAMSAEYRVASRHQTTPFECVTDGKSAVRWIRRHAGELGIDAARLAAGGGSAGGHVAAAAGTLAGWDEPDEDHSISSVPDALVLFNPVFDNSPEGFGNSRLGERWRELSPLHNIRPGVPPTVVFLGSEDKHLPVATAQQYCQVMEQAGARCDLHVYEGQPHGFFNYRDGTNPLYAATVREMDAFLESLGHLRGQPST